MKMNFKILGTILICFSASILKSQNSEVKELHIDTKVVFHSSLDFTEIDTLRQKMFVSDNETQTIVITKFNDKSTVYPTHEQLEKSYDDFVTGMTRKLKTPRIINQSNIVVDSLNCLSIELSFIVNNQEMRMYCIVVIVRELSYAFQMMYSPAMSEELIVNKTAFQKNIEFVDWKNEDQIDKSAQPVSNAQRLGELTGTTILILGLLYAFIRSRRNRLKKAIPTENENPPIPSDEK